MKFHPPGNSWSKRMQALQISLTLQEIILQQHTYWREAKVKPLHSILNMTIKQTFEEETSMSTIKSAANGLTAFAVPCMSEMEVKDHNEQAAALA